MKWAGCGSLNEVFSKPATRNQHQSDYVTPSAISFFSWQLYSRFLSCFCWIYVSISENALDWDRIANLKRVLSTPVRYIYMYHILPPRQVFLVGKLKTFHRLDLFSHFSRRHGLFYDTAVSRQYSYVPDFLFYLMTPFSSFNFSDEGSSARRPFFSFSSLAWMDTA